MCSNRCRVLFVKAVLHGSDSLSCTIQTDVWYWCWHIPVCTETESRRTVINIGLVSCVVLLERNKEFTMLLMTWRWIYRIWRCLVIKKDNSELTEGSAAFFCSYPFLGVGNKIDMASRSYVCFSAMSKTEISKVDLHKPGWSKRTDLLNYVPVISRSYL